LEAKEVVANPVELEVVQLVAEVNHMSKADLQYQKPKMLLHSVVHHAKLGVLVISFQSGR